MSKSTGGMVAKSVPDEETSHETKRSRSREKHSKGSDHGSHGGRCHHERGGGGAGNGQPSGDGQENSQQQRRRESDPPPEYTQPEENEFRYLLPNPQMYSLRAQMIAMSLSWDNWYHWLWSRLLFLGYPPEYIRRCIRPQMAKDEKKRAEKWRKFKERQAQEYLATNVISTLILGVGNGFLVCGQVGHVARGLAFIAVVCALFGLITGTALSWRLEPIPSEVLKRYTEDYPCMFPIMLSVPIVWQSWCTLLFVAALVAFLYQPQPLASTIPTKIVVTIVVVIGVATYAVLWRLLLMGDTVCKIVDEMAFGSRGGKTRDVNAARAEKSKV